jgi:polysaccharide pyruvyl transferase WcaK-like protein
MGDEAINAALVDALSGVRLVPVPLGVAAMARGVGRLAQLRRAPLLLGGGTVVGRRIWRIHLHLGLALTARTPAFMLGAGVEDPEFSRAGHLSERRELPRWRRLLRRFEDVTVRGPRSAELLADVGVAARVVGDPAFLLDPPSGIPAEGDLLGVNLGTSDDLWGHDQAAVVQHVSEAVRTLAARGRRFRFLVVNPADRPDAQCCAEQAGLGAGQWELVEATDPHRYMQAAAGCNVVLAERLHAGILAASAGVLPVMLEYQPKCRDFLRSVGLDQFGVRTDRLAAGHLLDLVEEAQSDGERRRAKLSSAVEGLRRELMAEAARMRTLIGPRSVEGVARPRHARPDTANSVGDVRG